MPSPRMYDKAVIERDALRQEVKRLRDALGVIRSTLCEHYTTGLGSCFENGRKLDAEYLADRVCDHCIADLALTQ